MAKKQEENQAPLPDLKLVRGKNGQPQWRAVAPREITMKKRTMFLDCLAVTCNISQSAKIIGIDDSNINRLRLRDSNFDAECLAALRTGYVRLEALLLERALTDRRAPLQLSAEPDEDGALSERAEGETPLPAPEAITNDQALRMLAHYQRTIEGVKAPTNGRGGHVPSMASEEETNTELLKRLKVLHRRQQKEAGDATAEEA
jgi:hypothetical protein